MPKLLLCLWLLLSSFSVSALPRHAPVPGGIAVIPLGPAGESPPTAHWGEQSLAVIREQGQWFTLLGIPLDTLPGELEIRVRQGSRTYSVNVPIRPKNYPEQRLTVKNQRHVDPDPDDLARIEREQKITEAVKKQFSPETPDTRLYLPATGPLSSRFGLKRFFNGQARNPHAGLDVAAATGTLVRAPANGVIANTGNYFFNGNTIFIDHGQGLISAYMHLARIDVTPGQRIKQGENIGTIGATGRVTGPHLHWAVILNNTPVDPELFLGKP